MNDELNIRKKILTIDDEPDERIYIATYLEDCGYVTDIAKDGFEGMEKVKSNPPNLITLDITMPGKSGVKFYREIREDPKFNNIPIIVITGVSGLGGDPKEFHKYLSTREHIPPPDGFIPKPVDLEVLVNMVKKLLQ
ncbi:response regulator [bacterium]|nr:response regulator [bacterium]